MALLPMPTICPYASLKNVSVDEPASRSRPHSATKALNFVISVLKILVLPEITARYRGLGLAVEATSCLVITVFTSTSTYHSGTDNSMRSHQPTGAPINLLV